MGRSVWVGGCLENMILIKTSRQLSTLDSDLGFVNSTGHFLSIFIMLSPGPHLLTKICALFFYVYELSIILVPSRPLYMIMALCFGRGVGVKLSPSGLQK